MFPNISGEHLAISRRGLGLTLRDMAEHGFTPARVAEAEAGLASAAYTTRLIRFFQSNGVEFRGSGRVTIPV